MDKTIEELVKGCRPFFSKKTRFLHWDGPYTLKHDSIPLFENFCFALALMRLKEKDAFLEGKDLLERLLPFQVENQFPKYLHDYPRCYRHEDILPVLKRIDSNLLGEKLKNDLLKAASKLESSLDFDTFQEEIPFWTPFQLHLKDGLSVYQEGLEPKRTLIDKVLSYYHQLPPQKLTPEDLKLVLYLPRNLELSPFHPHPRLIKGADLPKQPAYNYYWKHGSTINSLGLFTTSQVDAEILSDKIIFTFSLDEIPESIQDQKEIQFYLNKNTHPKFFLEGKRITAFRLNFPIDVITEFGSFKLLFEQNDHEAQFYGHIALANRPNQLLSDSVVYDWNLSIRTVRRKKGSILKIHLLPIN